MEKVVDRLIQVGRFEEGQGLSLEDIKALNERLEKDIPDFFISYLHFFGFNDNLFGGVFNEEADFIEQNVMIQELGFTEYVAIGDAYNENLLVVHGENQQLFLIEDDHLIDLQLTFVDSLFQVVESLDSNRFEIIQQVSSVYESFQDRKSLLKSTFMQYFNQLQTTVSNKEDQLYGVVIAKNSEGSLYRLCAGSFNTFKSKINRETINYNELWNPEKMDYHQTMERNEVLADCKTEVDFKALDLLFLDVLRDLKEEGYFNDQMDRFSISIQSGDVYLFPEDSHDESLMKEASLETKIRRFWESPYDRTRVLMELL